MKTVSSLLAITALCNTYTSLAFAPSNGECSSRTRTHLRATSSSSRRDFLSTSIATAATVATSTLVLAPLPSVADVSDGNVLPQGAAQFSRVIKVRAQLKSVAKRVTEQSDEIDKKEWDEIDNFLRTVYSAGEDMKVIGKGIYDPARKTKADADIKLLQGLVQVAQKPVKNKDAKGFGVVAAKADELFEDFFDALSDVPDEL
mmetsp:Transcript_27727/g.49982  ORF Transcript_27727/g.49982 Transcript_27727/m.49982 type:complete len:202 (+) Transcript_27727:135-740(+)